MRAHLRAGLGAALALCLFSTAFAARQVPRRPDYDALGSGQRPDRRPEAVVASRGEVRPGTRLHVEERLGLPTFLWSGDRGKLAPRAKRGPMTAPEAAREHLRQYAHLYRLDPADVETARVGRVHDTGRGGRIVTFSQEVDGIEVFRDEMRMILDKNDDLIAISGYLTRPQMRSRVFGLDAPQVLALALEDLTEFAFAPGDLHPMRAAGRGAGPRGEQKFLLASRAETDSGLVSSEPLRARKVWFRLSDGLEPAWLLDINIGPADGVDASYYGYVVSAVDGEVLLRKDFTVSESFTYRVWADPNSKVPDDGPQGTEASPHPTGVPDGYTPTFVTQRLVSLQNGPISTNDPWLDPNNNLTNGNNVDAYADINAPDGVSTGDHRAATTSLRTFDRIYNTALDPDIDGVQRRASITQLFYVTNWLHDDFYDHGFDEISGNAQKSNYGRGGIQNDDLRAEAQDYSGRNNANMSTPPDGGRPRMQMYIFDGAGTSSVTVHAPPAVAGGYVTGTAQFGPQTFTLSTTDVVLVNDGVAPDPNQTTTDGCTALVNGPAVSGKIALIDRGFCTFVIKAQNAQDAGAAGVIIANNTAGIINMSGTGGILIPVLSITQDAGTALKANQTGLNASMSRTSSTDPDGTIDNQIVTHEWGHYISNRLIGDAFGLNTNMAGGLGEGWADFHALLLTVRDGDANRPANPNYSGAYAMASYALGSPGSQAYYYGIRRAPLSTDPNINPLTYKHIQNGVPLPPGNFAFGHAGASNAQVHNTGEVWSLMLWECYAGLLRDTLGGSPRLTFAEAQSRMKDYLVGGYKMTPNSPTLLEARDAVLASAFANDIEDYEVCWEAFAKRGAGVGAVAPDRFSATNIGVVESFVTGGAVDVLSVSLTDDVATDCLPDGILDNGEIGTLSVSMKNTGSASLSATTGTVTSPNPNVSFPSGNVIAFSPAGPFGNMAGSIQVSLAGEVGADLAALQILVEDPALSDPNGTLTTGSFRVNADEVPASSATETVEGSVPVMVPTTGAGLLPWQRLKITGVDHLWLGPDSGSAGSTELTTPPLDVAGAGSFSFTFQHRYDFEASGGFFYDGGVLELSNNGGASWTDIGASITTPGGGYNATLEVGGSNPLEARPAFSGVSAGYPALIGVTVNLGTTYQGQTVLIRFRIGTDVFVSAEGWEIDNVAFSGITNTPFTSIVPHDPVCDDDGDSVTDGNDCAPANPALWSAPSAVLTLTAQTPVSGNVQFDWTAPSDFGGVAAPTYDLVRSSLSGGFSGGVCVESNDTNLSAVTSDAPAPGAINYFMVGARSACARRFAPASSGFPQTVVTCP